MTNNKISQIPCGFKDRFFEIAKKKKKIESIIEKVFDDNSYSLVITPTVEYSSVFYQGLKEEDFNKLFQFFDNEGNLLALRADPTCAIARLVCTKLVNYSFPLRIYYITNVFRKNEPYVGKLHEFTQAGAELIGENSIDKDLEIINLIAEILNSLIPGKYQINISHTDYLEGILDEIKLNQCIEKRNLFDLIGNRKQFELENYLKTLDISSKIKNFLLKIPSLIGDEEILEKIYQEVSNEKSKNSILYLMKLNKKLKRVNAKIVYDLGEVKKFDYYTGIIFKLFAYGSAYPIGGGGRYDKLLEKFGKDMPAIGFSLTVDRIEELVE